MLKIDTTYYAIKNHLMKDLVVLIDTRENANEHITQYFDKVGILYEERKLDYGDYGLKIPKNDEFGIVTDMILDFAVERKGSLEEVSGNFTQDRTRLEKELFRSKGNLAILIENGSLNDILSHNYTTKYDENSFIGTLMAFYHRYNTSIWFTNKLNSGKIIYGLLKYKLREELK